MGVMAAVTNKKYLKVYIELPKPARVTLVNNITVNTRSNYK